MTHQYKYNDAVAAQIPAAARASISGITEAGALSKDEQLSPDQNSLKTFPEVRHAFPLLVGKGDSFHAHTT